MTAIPNGAACYFCLEEGPDDNEMPLVRDCSCRGGDSAGFAHQSCLVKYAEQKCRKVGDGDVVAFAEPWGICNNCKRPFQNQLAIDLASAFVSFAEATYGHVDNSKWDKLKVMKSLLTKIMALGNMERMSTDKEVIKMEMTSIINEMLDMIKQMKKDLNMSRWIHKPKGSVEYEYYILVGAEFEAYALLVWGD